MTDIKEILEKTEKKLIADNTDTPIKSDFNDCVDATAIALRELMIYGDFPQETKKSIQFILSRYGLAFENDFSHFQRAVECVQKLCPYINWKEGVQFMSYPLCMHEIKMFEIMIQEVLLQYWQDYTIPTSNYDDIEYMHINVKTSPCDSYKHHYKCLYDKSLEWDTLEKEYEYEIVVTGKEIKEMALLARDSGGNLDYAGDAHIGTTMNVVCGFMEDKLDLPYEWQWTKEYEDNEELEQIMEEIYNEVCSAMGDYMISLY